MQTAPGSCDYMSRSGTKPSVTLLWHHLNSLSLSAQSGSSKSMQGFRSQQREAQLSLFPGILRTLEGGYLMATH